jgi:5-(carboxyamino)imidazole ribonucleotide synthase
MKRVGILGGGQLGMLLSQSILRLGAEAIVFDPDPSAPACRAVRESINAPWDDRAALARFFDRCDVVTYEFENVPSTSLKMFEAARPIYPSLSVLEKTQNRILEKSFLKESGLPHVNFAFVDDPAQLVEATGELAFPVIAKSAIGGYDGKFQYLLESKEDAVKLSDRLKKLHQSDLAMSIEEVVDLQCELSCLSARSIQGKAITFPIFRNTHADHILDTTTVPADITDELAEAIVDISLRAAKQLNVTGLLCTEFFIAASDEKKRTGERAGKFTIYINEFAPRPHNSGHVTAAACTMSQFDALARVLLNIPLTEPKLLAPGHYCMGNLLGDLWSQQGKAAHDDLDLSTLSQHPKVIDTVIYGKTEAKAKRKMGHLIAYADSAEEAEAAVKQARESLTRTAQPKLLKP